MTTWRLIVDWLHTALDAVFGERCRLGCGERVWPNDVGWHERDEHAGDRIWEGP